MSSEEKIVCTGLTRAANAGQKSLVLAQRAQRTNQGRTPFICTPWVPICLSFNSRQGPPLSGLSGKDLGISSIYSSSQELYSIGRQYQAPPIYYRRVWEETYICTVKNYSIGVSSMFLKDIIINTPNWDMFDLRIHNSIICNVFLTTQHVPHLPQSMYMFFNDH